MEIGWSHRKEETNQQINDNSILTSVPTQVNYKRYWNQAYWWIIMYLSFLISLKGNQHCEEREQEEYRERGTWYLYTWESWANVFCVDADGSALRYQEGNWELPLPPLEYSRAQFSPRISRVDRCHNCWIQKRAKKSLRSTNAPAV
jgi:hypothetical protein